MTDSCSVSQSRLMCQKNNKRTPPQKRLDLICFDIFFCRRVRLFMSFYFLDVVCMLTFTESHVFVTWYAMIWFMWLPLTVWCYYIGEAVCCLEPWWRSSGWTLFVFLFVWPFILKAFEYFPPHMMHCFVFGVHLLFCSTLFPIVKEHPAQLLSTQ